ncbi:GAF domain-containing sensor histidine kinase [Lentzea sp. NEAU-D13]|uniref:GAF domain-containing sensor histidine kinase n=1 Tax=Lentzea alba TaxID=2714351 RepID=A0A7C9VZJ3_9PSEU|nr:GAF domain-containing sensor histidine kinase [Lentzea alba]NGY61697.1 GAF domain-containing sensor histidine kinase [Lentzea alba]
MDPSLARRVLVASTEITSAALEDPENVLRLVVEAAAEIADADLGLAMLATGEDDGTLTVEASSGEPVVATLSPRSAAAKAARTGVPVMADDVTNDPRTAPYVPQALRSYGPFAVAPFGTSDRKIGALAVYRRRDKPPFTQETVDVLTAFAAQAGLAVVLSEGFTARQRVAVYEERERIARDLHDVIIQRLYGAGVQLSLLERRLGKKLDSGQRARIEEAVELVDETIAEVRATVRALRNTDPADSADLHDSIKAEVRTAGELLGFAPRLHVVGDLANVPRKHADDARAALREALSNVVRHSGATHVQIDVRRDEKHLLLRVADNGCGIPSGVTQRGLRHLAERAKSANGDFRVVSSPNGTTLTWSVPV